MDFFFCRDGKIERARESKLMRSLACVIPETRVLKQTRGRGSALEESPPQRNVDSSHLSTHKVLGFSPGDKMGTSTQGPLALNNTT